MKTLLLVTTVAGALLAPQLAMADCQTIYVNGKPQTICSPPPPPPPACTGPFCPPRPTR
jgi:hypothetical protein